MVTAARYDTTCPNCNQSFEVEETLSEGNCPFCNVHLRFLEEAPPPAPGMPSLAPPSYEPRTYSGPPARETPATNGDGGFPVTCPRCASTFTVAREAESGACPSCNAPLTFENRYPTAIEAFTIRCPSCGATSGVAATATHANCPHCGSALKLENVYPGQETALGAAPAPLPEPVAEAPASPAPDQPKRGLFKRFTREPDAPAPEAAPPPQPEAPVEVPQGPASDLPPPIVAPPPGGLPYVLSCPTCKKEFSVGPKEHEGNCPHCNAPLAFLTDKEYEALLEAEERKRAFQAKLQQKRLERKKKEEERLAREAATTPERAGMLSRLRPGKKTPEATPQPEAAPAPGPEAKPKRGWFGKGKEGTAPEPPTAPTSPATPEAAAAVTVEAPTPAEAKPTKAKKARAKPEPAAVEVAAETAVVEAAPAPESKKGLLARFRREKAPAAPTAPATVEGSSVDVVGFESAPSTPPVEETKPSRRKKSEAPVAAEPIVAIEPAPVEVSAEAAPTPAKRNLLSRFKREKASAMPALVEPAAIEMGGTEVAAAPAPEPTKPKSKKAKPAEPTPAPAGADVAIEFAADIEAAPASATPPPKRGLLSRFKREKKPEGPTALVETGEIDFANGSTSDAATIEMTPSEAPAAQKPAARKRRK